MSANLIWLLWEATLQTLYMVAASTVLGTAFGLPLGVAERDQIISVSDHHRRARLGVASLAAGGDVADSRGVFQPVQRDVKE